MTDNKLKITELLEETFNRNGSYHSFSSYMFKVNMFTGHFLLTYETVCNEKDGVETNEIDWHTARVIRMEDYINKDGKHKESIYGWKSSDFLHALLNFLNNN